MILNDRAPFYCPDLINRLPAGYKVMLVMNSTGYLTDDGWEYVEADYGTAHTVSIEILNAKDEIRAAVGWSCPPHERSVFTVGTWVHPRLRRRGLAQAMWRAMIEHSGRTRIESYIVSDEGWTLVRSMREQLGPRIKIAASGDWALTDLRTGEVKGKRRRAA